MLASSILEDCNYELAKVLKASLDWSLEINPSLFKSNSVKILFISSGAKMPVLNPININICFSPNN